MVAQEPENVVGVTLFFLYIIAALLLTTLLTKDVWKVHEHRVRSTDRHQKPQIHHAGGPKFELNISLFATLAALSFTVLSYHMLNFLVQSYQSWTLSAGSMLSCQGSQSHSSTPYYNKNIPGNIPLVQIWKWATHSNLFQNFGEAICNDPHRFWWTQLTLTYSYGWNIYMAIQGVCRRLVP